MEDEVVSRVLRIRILFNRDRSEVLRIIEDLVVRLLIAIDGPPVQQEQIGKVMSFGPLERFANGDERTQRAAALLSHPKGREGEPYP